MIENHNLLIKSMEMSVEEQYFIMKMETDRNSMKDHDFRCCIYADDYFLMCTDAEENAPKVRRGTVRLKMQSRFPWLAGHYKLHFSLAESLMGVMEFQVDEQQDVEIQAINAYGIFDPDDIAMSFLANDTAWGVLATLPGTKELRLATIEANRMRLWAGCLHLNVKDSVRQPSGYEESLQELNQMVGLDNIKKSITTIAHQVKIFAERRQQGLPTNTKDVFHAVFTGSPGTGKTTVAKMLGRIYHQLGLLSKGEVICVDRSRIVGRFIGDTEDNVKNLLREAQGNVLFIDEAYSLYSSEGTNDYGRRAVESLLTSLSEKNPDMLVIFAGYKEEMDRLMTMNPGLVGRFPYKFHFRDYTADELMQIAQSLLARDEYMLTDEAEALLLQTIRDTVAQKNKNFGNARWIEQYVSNGIIPALADRLASTAHPFTREVYQRIEATDIQRAYEKFNPKTIELKPRRQVGFSA